MGEVAYFYLEKGDKKMKMSGNGREVADKTDNAGEMNLHSTTVYLHWLHVNIICKVGVITW